MTDSATFPKTHHLLTPGQFSAVYDARLRVYTPHVTVCMKDNGLTHCRLGLSVSRKFGNAVKRNRFKRQVREIFRQHQANIFPPVDLIIIPGREKTTDFATLEKDLCELWGIQPKPKS